MRTSLCLACAAATALSVSSAQALTCNIVLDRNGSVIYQDVTPPVDMSERGAAARERMRDRGELLMIIESEQCPRLVFSPVTGAASVESIVAEMRPYIASGRSASSNASGSAPAATQGAASAPQRSSAPSRY